MENIFLIVALAPLPIVFVFVFLRHHWMGRWLVRLARDWGEHLKRKPPPDDQLK